MIPLVQITIGFIPSERQYDLDSNREIYKDNYVHIKLKEPNLIEGRYGLTIAKQKCLLSDYFRIRYASQREIICADWDFRFNKKFEPVGNGLPFYAEYNGCADGFVLSSVGSTRFFREFLMRQRYRMWVYSWQRKMLRNITDYNVIPTSIYTHNFSTLKKEDVE